MARKPATLCGVCKTEVTILGGTINDADPKIGTKMYLILNGDSVPVSEIKLIRTDTTLDLSQKAEKVWGIHRKPSALMENYKHLHLWVGAETNETERKKKRINLICALSY